MNPDEPGVPDDQAIMSILFADFGETIPDSEDATSPLTNASLQKLKRIKQTIAALESVRMDSNSHTFHASDSPELKG